ncbi:MAG TPA: hypothetical protein VER55_04195 [Ardenticatenaceae bacterium]|nr:hypothetical protein [Ardenticatenaceae bacterium]
MELVISLALFVGMIGSWLLLPGGSSTSPVFDEGESLAPVPAQ